MLKNLATLALAAFLCAGAWASDRIDMAKQVYAAYFQRYQAFDPAVVELYSDRALIKNTRTYPTGQVRELVLPAQQYNQLIRDSLFLAQARGDRSEYRDPVLTEEKAGVRILLTRFSVLKAYTSPLSLLIGQDETGAWLVLEELSASIP